jgi:hypothetical protein
MKCDLCGKPATTVRIIETKGGSGMIITKLYACKIHAGFGRSPDININVIRRQEYGPVNHTGNDPS